MGDAGFGIARLRRARGFVFTVLCLAVLAGCSKSDDANGPLDTSRLPRVAGAGQTFASAATTIYTSPLPVAQTAEAVGQALADSGWQRYVVPFAAQAKNPSMAIMQFKRGPQALNVFITVAPAQNSATSVQYGAIALKNDLPFAKDASNIEYDPDRPLLTLVTAEPVDKTLDFYRQQLGALGWALWSEKLNARQPAGGPSGKIHERGAYAHYVNDKQPSVALVLTLQRAEPGRFKVELKEWPIGILTAEHKAYLNAPNSAALIDVGRLPRLEGAKVNAAKVSATRVSYTVLGSFANTAAATRKLLAADGWKEYVSPSETPSPYLMRLKKGPQGLSVFLTMPAGEPVHSGVDYSPARLSFDLPLPADATDIVFDDRRPYLNCVTAGTVDATLASFDKDLGALGWARLSAEQTAKRWPNAKLDEKAENGVRVYYIGETQRPILLSLRRGADGKTEAEIKVAPFALPQVLENGSEVYGLPIPKLSIGSGGTRGQTEHEAHATVPADLGAVLAFYRRELAKRHWNEEPGAAVDADKAALRYTAPEGTAELKLNRKYDLIFASLVLQIPKAAAKPAAKTDSPDAIMQQAQQMLREAAAEALAGMKSPPAAQAPSGPPVALRVLAENKGPIPVPEAARDIEFDGNDGRLEFNSPASVKSLADFYRGEMKRTGWQEQPSVINKANMVVLNFAKSGKTIAFTIMQMGAKANVSAGGSGLKSAAAAAKSETARAPEPGDLDVEDSGGLPVPKRHTMSEGTSTQFRHELKASVPLDLTAVLGFYRGELGKRGWKEAPGAVVGADKAVVAYASPDGSGVLKLARKDGATGIELAVRDSAKAKQAGIAPKAGQVKMLFGNILDSAAEITIARQTVKVGPQVGVKKPDGPMLELAPGKYKLSLKVAGKPAQSEEVEVAADETWGLMIGPGGILPLHVY